MKDLLPNAWDVLVLFSIPVGGGIPAGVVLAHERGLAWPVMMLLYLISDVALALVFEPVLHGFTRVARTSPGLTRFMEAYRTYTARVVARYGGGGGGWFRLVLISFGVDPMTGRAAALAAGHGFVAGWMVAIAGDMIFFTVLMISTLWLNNVLGDGTWAAVIIMTVMLVVPFLVQRFRARGTHAR